jgi:hypothetical protein
MAQVVNASSLIGMLTQHIQVFAGSSRFLPTKARAVYNSSVAASVNRTVG